MGTRDGRTQFARACKPALLHLGFRTWVSGPRYLALKTWVLGPGQTHMLSGPRFQDLDRRMHRYRTPKALHPTVIDRCSILCLIFFPITFLCVQWSQTHARTHRQAKLYIWLFPLLFHFIVHHKYKCKYWIITITLIQLLL